MAMTLLQKFEAAIKDLKDERAATTNIWWAERLDYKIAELEREMALVKSTIKPPHNDGPEHVCPECVRTLLERE